MQQDSSPQIRGFRPARRQRDGGYLLLAIMLMMAFMVITLAYVVGPSVVQQMKRDREEEMIHRGTEYARAIKKYYKKNARYPTSLDDLDKGQIRFLRKRYKDPLTKDGKWKVLRYGDIQTLLNAGAPGTPAGALNQGGTLTPGGAIVPGVPSPAGGASSFSLGSQPQVSPQAFQQQQLQGQQYPGAQSGFSTNSDQGSNPEGVPTNTFGFGNSGGGQQGGLGGNQPGGFGNNGQQGGTTFGQNSGGGNQVFGGGALVGVASESKDPTIRIYNKKKKYDEWVFIYNPMMDQQNVLLRGPYQPITIGSRGIGTPASQLSSQQQGAFGQQPGAFGQQNGAGQQGGFGQQQPSGSYSQQPNLPQSLQPGNNYPPDQNQQQ